MAQIKVSAYIIRTQFQPAFEYEDALKIAKNLKVPLHAVDFDILSVPGIIQNTQNRCYLCKNAIFSEIQKQAESDGFNVLCDGTNASDDVTDRPGFRALQELGVLSPLRCAGFSKTLIRHLSALCSLPTAAKPAYACLATRIPFDTPLSSQTLTKIEDAENRIRSLGFMDFRIRIFHGAARMQFRECDFIHAAAMRRQIQESLSDLFEDIFFDTEIR